MPSREHLVRLAMLEESIAPSHRSTAFYRGGIDDPEELLKLMLREDHAERGRCVLFIPERVAIEQWERETEAQQQQLMEAERERHADRRNRE